MPLDPSILFQAGRGVTKLLTPDEIADQRMQRELGNYKLQTLRQGMDDDAAQRAIAQSTAPEGLAGAYYKAGLVKPAQDAMKFQTDQQKSKREAEKAQLDAMLKKFEVSAQIMSGVNDQATWDRAKTMTAEAFGPEVAAQLPAQYDPALIAQNQKRALSVKDQIEQERKRYEFETPSANALLSARTSTDNNRASIAQSAQNAQMTDTRARDLNSTKAEEVRIKREQKDETANLTKASQIASFDTMLGTLDRLGQHPGLKRSVGLVGALPTIPGSDSANFQAELNTFQSQAFLPMVAQLKGMGALSDAEGKKLTAAVGALDPKMGEKAFRESVQRITDDMNAARGRMVGTGGKSASATAPAQRKTIGGKTYENDGKGWYPVE